MNLDLTADYIDVRDIIARVEELRGDRFDFCHEDESTPLSVDAWEDAKPEEADELTMLTVILDDLRGNGGDEQWEGDWYPITLIRESYFEEAMDEMLEDIGDIPRDLPSYLTVTVDYDALKMDYTSVEIDSVTYWYR